MSGGVQHLSAGERAVVHVARNVDDPIIYFTLVDFLIQLLFFGLFLIVVLKFGGNNDDEVEITIKKSDVLAYNQFKDNLPFYKGMSELVPADSQQAMLDFLQNLKASNLLDAFLKFATQADDPLKIIEYCAGNPAVCNGLVAQCGEFPKECRRFAEAKSTEIDRMMSAFGLPPCIEEVTPPPSLFSIIGYGDGRKGGDGRFKIHKISSYGHEVLSRGGISLKDGQEITKREAQERFEVISRRRLNCEHYVDYIAETDSETMRGILAQYFTPRVKVFENGQVVSRTIPAQ